MAKPAYLVPDNDNVCMLNAGLASSSAAQPCSAVEAERDSLLASQILSPGIPTALARALVYHDWMWRDSSSVFDPYAGAQTLEHLTLHDNEGGQHHIVLQAGGPQATHLRVLFTRHGADCAASIGLLEAFVVDFGQRILGIHGVSSHTNERIGQGLQATQRNTSAKAGKRQRESPATHSPAMDGYIAVRCHSQIYVLKLICRLSSRTAGASPGDISVLCELLDCIVFEPGDRPTSCTWAIVPLSDPASVARRVQRQRMRQIRSKAEAKRQITLAASKGQRPAPMPKSRQKAGKSTNHRRKGAPKSTGRPVGRPRKTALPPSLPVASAPLRQLATARKSQKKTAGSSASSGQGEESDVLLPSGSTSMTSPLGTPATSAKVARTLCVTTELRRVYQWSTCPQTIAAFEEPRSTTVTSAATLLVADLGLCFPFLSMQSSLDRVDPSTAPVPGMVGVSVLDAQALQRLYGVNNSPASNALVPPAATDLPTGEMSSGKWCSVTAVQPPFTAMCSWPESGAGKVPVATSAWVVADRTHVHLLRVVQSLQRTAAEKQMLQMMRANARRAQAAAREAAAAAREEGRKHRQAALDAARLERQALVAAGLMQLAELAELDAADQAQEQALQQKEDEAQKAEDDAHVDSDAAGLNDSDNASATSGSSGVEHKQDGDESSSSSSGSSSSSSSSGSSSSSSGDDSSSSSDSESSSASSTSTTSQDEQAAGNGSTVPTISPFKAKLELQALFDISLFPVSLAQAAMLGPDPIACAAQDYIHIACSVLEALGQSAASALHPELSVALANLVVVVSRCRIFVLDVRAPYQPLLSLPHCMTRHPPRTIRATVSTSAVQATPCDETRPGTARDPSATATAVVTLYATGSTVPSDSGTLRVPLLLTFMRTTALRGATSTWIDAQLCHGECVSVIRPMPDWFPVTARVTGSAMMVGTNGHSPVPQGDSGAILLHSDSLGGLSLHALSTHNNVGKNSSVDRALEASTLRLPPNFKAMAAAQKGVRSAQHDQARVWTLSSLCASVDGANSAQQHAGSVGDVELGDDEPPALARTPLVKAFTVNVPPLHKCQQTAPVQSEKHVMQLLAQAADTLLIPSISLECTSGVPSTCSGGLDLACAAAGPDILTLAATSSMSVRQQAIEHAGTLKATAGSSAWAMPSASRADETASAAHLHVDGLQPSLLTHGSYWTKDAAENCSDSSLPESLQPSAADAGIAPIAHRKSYTAMVALLSPILGAPLPTMPPAQGEEDQPVQDARRIPVTPFTHGGFNPGLTAVVYAMMLQRAHEAVSSALSHGLSPALVRHALQQQALAHARVDSHTSIMSERGQRLQVDMVDGSMWRQDLCSLLGVQVRWPAQHALAVGSWLRHFGRTAAFATSSANRQLANGGIRSRRLVLRTGWEKKGIEQEERGVPVPVWNPAVLKEEGKGNKGAGRRARAVDNSKDDDDSSNDDSGGSDVGSGDDDEMSRPRQAVQPSSGLAAKEDGPSDTMKNLRRQQVEALLQLKAFCSSGPASTSSAGSVRPLEQQMSQVRAALSDQATVLSLLQAPISLFSLTETLKTRLSTVDISDHAVAQVMHELMKDEVCSVLRLPQEGLSKDGKPQGTQGVSLPMQVDAMADADAMEAAEDNSMQVENETGVLVRAIDGIPRDHVASASLQACLKDAWVRVPSAALLGTQSMTSDSGGSAESSIAATADELPAGTVPFPELAKKSGPQLAALIRVKPVRVKVTAPSPAALKKKAAASASPSEDDSDDADDGSSTDGPSAAASPVGHEPKAYKWKHRVVRIRVIGQDGKKYSFDTGAGICDGMGTLPASYFEACLQRAARSGGTDLSAPVAWAAIYSPPPKVRVKNVWTKSVTLGRFGSPLEACAFAQVYAAWPQACMPLPAQATRHEVVQAIKRLPALWAQVAIAMVHKVARSVNVAIPASSSLLLKRVQPVESTFPPRAERHPDDSLQAANPFSMDVRGHDQPCACSPSAYVPCASRTCLLPHRILYMRPDTSSVTRDGTVAALAPPYLDVGLSVGTHRPLAGKVYHVKPEDSESPSFKAAFKTGFASDLRWMVGIAGTKRFHAGMPRKTGNNEERAKSAGARAGGLTTVSSSSTSKPEAATAPSAEDGDHDEDEDDGQLASLLGVSQASRAPVSSYSQAGRTPAAFMASQYTAVSSIRPSFGARLGQGTGDDASTREDDEDEFDGWGGSGAADRQHAPAASASGKRSYGRPMPPAAARAYIEGRLTSLDGKQVRIQEARAWQRGVLSAKASAARVAKVGPEHALTCHPVSTVSGPMLQQLAARWHSAVQDPLTGGTRPRAYKDEFTAEEEQGEEDEEEQQGELPSASPIGPQGDDQGEQDEEDEEGSALQQAFLAGAAWRAQQQAQNAAKAMEDEEDDDWPRRLVKDVEQPSQENAAANDNRYDVESCPTRAFRILSVRPLYCLGTRRRSCFAFVIVPEAVVALTAPARGVSSFVALLSGLVPSGCRVAGVELVSGGAGKQLVMIAVQRALSRFWRGVSVPCRAASAFLCVVSWTCPDGAAPDCLEAYSPLVSQPTESEPAVRPDWPRMRRNVDAPAGFGGGFGAARQPTTGGFGAAGFGGFGAPAPAPAVSLSFGVAPAPAPTGFGTAFGAAPAPALSFGAAPAPSPAPAFGGFGAPAPAPTFGAPAFGAQAAPAFGAPAPAPAAAGFSFGGFGAAPAQAPAPAAAGFGGLGGGFGGFGAAAPAPAAAPGGLFGQPAANTAFGGFGGAAASAPGGTGNPKYTPSPGGAEDTTAAGARLNYLSIETMQAYTGKTAEELRWEDKQKQFYGKGSVNAQNAAGGGLFGGQPGGGAFGSPAAAPGGFGAAARPAFGGFGATPAPAPAPAFGGFGTAGAFGAPAPAPAPAFGGFGAPAPAPAAGAFNFGGFGAAPAPAPAPAFGGFGAPAPAPAPAPAFGGFGTTGAFGAPAPAPAPAFGGFGAPAPAPAAGAFNFGGFGAAPAPAPAPAFGGFGSTAFGAPTPAPAPAFGGFGAPAPAPAPGAFNFGAFGTASAAAPVTTGAPAAAPAPVASVSTMKDDPFGLAALQKRLDENVGGLSSEDEKKLVERRRALQQAAAAGQASGAASSAHAASPSVDSPPLTERSAPRFPARSASRSTPYGLARAAQSRLRASMGPSSAVAYTPSPTQPQQSGTGSPGAVALQSAFDQASLSPQTSWGAGGVLGRSSSVPTSSTIGPRAGASSRKSTSAALMGMTYSSPGALQAAGGSPLGAALQFDYSAVAGGSAVARLPSLSMTSSASLVEALQQPVVEEVSTGGAGFSYRLNGTLVTALKSTQPFTSGGRQHGMMEAMGGLGQGGINITVSFPPDLEAKRLHFLLSQSSHLDGQQSLATLHALVPEMGRLSPQQKLLLAALATVRTVTVSVPSANVDLLAFKSLAVQQRRDMAVDIVREYRSICERSLAGSTDGVAAASSFASQQAGPDLQDDACVLCPVDDDMDMQRLRSIGGAVGSASSVGGGMYPSLGPALGAGGPSMLEEEAVLDVITLADEHFVLTANNMVLPEETEDGPLRLADVGLTRSAEVNAVYTDPSPPPAYGGAGAGMATGGGEPAYARSQAGASPGPLSPSALAGDGYARAAWDRYERARAQRPSLPKLPDVRDEYETSPSYAEFLTMSEEQIARVHNFTVSHPNLGSITWLEPVDLRGLDVRGMVTFDAEAMAVFVRGRNMEEHGPLRQDLNFPARITLQATEADGAQAREIERELRAYCTGNGSMTYEQYDPVRGLFTFRVEHFSGYGLPAHLAARKKARTGAESSASNQSLFASSAAPLSVSALGAATGPIGHPLGFRIDSEAVPPLAVQPSRSIAQVGVGGSRMAEGTASYAAGASSIMQEDRLQDSAAHLLPSFKRAAVKPAMGTAQGAGEGVYTNASQTAVPPATPAQSLVPPTSQPGAGTGLGPLTEVKRVGYGLPAHLRSASRTVSHSMARSESTAMSVEGADGAWGGEAAPTGGRSVSQSMLGRRPVAPPATPATHTMNGMHITAEELAVAQRTDTVTYVQQEEGHQQELVGPFALPANMSRFGPTTPARSAGHSRGDAVQRSGVDVSVKLLSEWEVALREVEARSAAAVKAQEDASKPGKDQSLPDPDAVPPPAGYPVKRAAWLPVSGPTQGEVHADADYAHQAHIAYRGAAPVTAPSTSQVSASQAESAWPWSRASLIQQKAGEGVGTKFGVNIVNHPTEALEAEISQALLFQRSFRASVGHQGLIAHRGFPLNKTAPVQAGTHALARSHPAQLTEDFEQTTVQTHQAALVGGTSRPIAATRPLQVGQARSLPAVKPCTTADTEASRSMSAQEMLQYHGRHWVHVQDSAVLARHAADAPTLFPLREFHSSGETTGRLVIEATPQGLAVRSLPPGGTDTFDAAAICCPALPCGDQLLQHVDRLIGHAERELQQAQSHAVEARHQEMALQGKRVEAGAAAHTVRLWHLVRALFGPAHDPSDAPFGHTHGMPNLGGPTPQAAVAACLCDPALAEAAALVSSSEYMQYERSMARKARLCDWLHASLAPMSPVAQSGYPLSASDCASGRWKLAQVHAGILAALLRHDVDTAVEIAVRSGHSLLSVLCASVGGVDREGKRVASGAQDEDVKDMIFAQLRSWASKPSTAPPAGVMATYMLLAGAVSPASAQGIESSGLQSLDEAGTGASPLDLSKVHWLQALAAHMWYGQPVTSTLADVLASYDSAVQAEAASVPCPWYVTEPSLRAWLGKSKDAMHYLATGASTQPVVCTASMTYKEEALEAVKVLGLPPSSLVHAQARAGCRGVHISEPQASKAMDGISAWREALSHMSKSSINTDGSLVLEPARDALFAVLQLGVLSSSSSEEGGDEEEDARHWVQVALEATSHGPSVADVSTSWQLGMVLLSFTSASHRSSEARRVVLAKRRAEEEFNRALQGLGQAGVSEEVKAQLLAVLTPAYARSSVTATSQPLWGMPLRLLASLACDYADALAAAGVWHWAVHVLQTTAGAIAAASINQPGVDDSGAILAAPLQSTLVPEDASCWVRALQQVAHDVTLRFVPSIADELLPAAEQLSSACAPELSARLQQQGPVCAQGSKALSQGLPAPDALHVCHRAAQAVNKDELGGRQLAWPARAAWLLHYGLVPRVWLLQAIACRALSEAHAGATVAILCMQALLDPACAHEVKASQGLLAGSDTALDVPLHDWAAAALARVVTRQVAPVLLCSYESALALARLEANRDPSAPQEPTFVHPPTLPSVAGLFTGLTTVCPYSSVHEGAESEARSGPWPGGIEVLPTGYPGAVRTVLGLPDLAHALTVLQSAAVAGMVSQGWCRSPEYKQSVLLLRWMQQRHPSVLPPALRQACDMQAVQSSARVWLENEQDKTLPFRVKAGQDVSMDEARRMSTVSAPSDAWHALLVDYLHGVVEAE